MRIDPKDSEAQLIIGAIGQDCIHKLQSKGVVPSGLLVWGETLEFVYGHLRKYGGLPNIETLFLAFSEFPRHSPDHCDVEFLIDIALENARRKKMKEAIETAIDLNEEDPSKCASYLMSQIPDIEKNVKTLATYIDSSPRERIEAYLEKKEQLSRGIQAGLRTGISALDKELLGWMDGDFVLIIGPPEAGKSWTVMRTCVVAYMAGAKVLYVCPEMIEEDITFRWHTLLGREYGYTFSNEDLMAGTLSNVDEYEDFLYRIGDRAGWLVVTDIEGGKFTVPKIEGLIREHNPQIIAIDSLPLMTASDGALAVSWTGLLDVAYGLKFLATRTKTVIIGTSLSTGGTFGREEPAGPEELGLGRYVLYAPDIAMSIAPARDPKKRWIRVIKKRKGRQIVDKFPMAFDPNIGRLG